MKKIILKFTVILTLILSSNIYALANNNDTTSSTSPTTCPEGSYFDLERQSCRKYVPEFTKDPNISLPEVTLEGGIGVVIRTILGWSMLIALVAIVYAGVILLLARGNEEEAGKAKKIITYLVIGMLIMAAAYGLVSGVSQFNFFN